MDSEGARQYLSKVKESPLPWSLCLWAAIGARSVTQKVWLLTKASALGLWSLCGYRVRCHHTSSPDPMGYHGSHPWCVVAQDLMTWCKWQELLVLAIPKTPKEVSKLLTKCKMPIEVASLLLSQAYQQAKSLVQHSQGSGSPSDPASTALVEADVHPRELYWGQSRKSGSRIWI